LPDWLRGPKIDTFTCRVPFVLGFDDSFNHRIEWPGQYVEYADQRIFGSTPFVNIRIFNAPLADDLFWPANMPVAIRHFYGGDIGPPPAEDQMRTLLEQWVTLETPGALLDGENPDDAAYAFHRCLGVLNGFLQALGLSRSDDRLRSVSARELRPIVIIGAITEDLQWHFVSKMLMHPDAKERGSGKRSVDVHLANLNAAIAAIQNEEPFIPSRQWQSRAQRRRYEGDAADSVISFQIAAETLLYETWRILMVDEGASQADLSAKMLEELPFKTLLVRELHSKLGGSWDTTLHGTAVGDYWTKLYLKRNRILHAGYQPHDGDAEEAESVFSSLEAFLEERLRANLRSYPRTLLAKLGTQELQSRGWMTKWMHTFIEQVDSEPAAFYLPWDAAGRKRP
jgi:hypothetical protein